MWLPGDERVLGLGLSVGPARTPPTAVPPRPRGPEILHPVGPVLRLCPRPDDPANVIKRLVLPGQHQSFDHQADHVAPVPAETCGANGARTAPHTGQDRGHGRDETRTIQVLPAPGDLPFPHAAQVFLIERHVRSLDGSPRSDVAALGVTSLTRAKASPAGSPRSPEPNGPSRTACTTAVTSPSAKMPPASAPATRPVPWPPSAATPSPACASTAGRTSHQACAGQPATTPTPSRCSVSLFENADPLPPTGHVPRPRFTLSWKPYRSQ